MRVPLLVAAVSAIFVAPAAQALPMQTGGAFASTPQVMLIAGGCGLGFHRGAFGHCRPNGGFGRRLSYGIGGGSHRTTATGGNAGGYSSRN